MKFDSYTRKARIYPAVLVLIPFLIFTINCNIQGLNAFFDDLVKVKVIGNITISIVLLYLLTFTNRFLGKFLFERKLFKEELEMPTTKFLLFSNTVFSKNYKIQIRDKVKLDFKLDMPTEEDEISNENDCKKRIVEAVGLIRQKVKNGRLLLQHNIEYGFARNLIGGAIIGLVISIFNVIYFFLQTNYLLGWINAVIAVVFAFLLLFHRFIITYLGNQYAKRLFQEYIQL